MLGVLLCFAFVPALRTSRSMPLFVSLLTGGIVANGLLLRAKKRPGSDHAPARFDLRSILFNFVLASPLFVFAFACVSDATDRQSAPFKDALSVLRRSSQANDALGRPIRIEWPLEGETSISGDEGRSALSIPVKGSLDRGNLFVRAKLSHSVWSITELTLVLSKNQSPVDLLTPSMQTRRN
jgi:hypothetical protein